MAVQFRLILLVFGILIFQTNSSGQQVIHAQRSGYARLVPITGINGNAMYKNTWTNSLLLDSFKLLKPLLIRYPGGTPGNYWNWSTGWPGPTFSTCYPNAPTPTLTVRFEELKLALEACKSDMLYTLNMFHSDLSTQVNGMNHAFSLGIPLKYLELGNEYNLHCDSVYSPLYASTAKYWCDSIRSLYPSAKLCLVGGDVPNSAPNWINDIKNKNIDFDAFSFHVYPLPGGSPFNVKSTIGQAYSSTGQRYASSHFSSMPNKDVWVTEYNMSTLTTAIGNSWTQTLFILSMFDTLIQYPAVKVMLPWGFSGRDTFFQALNYSDFSMKATGLAVRFINDALEGKDSCRKIVFPALSYQKYGGLVYPKVFAYEFYNGISSSILAVNLSEDTLSMDLSGLYSNANGLVFSYTADTAQQITNGFQSIKLTSKSFNSSVQLVPYSISKMDLKQQSTEVFNKLDFELKTKIFPVPSSKIIHIESPFQYLNYSIIDAHGRKKEQGDFHSEIEISHLTEGLYFIELSTSEGQTSFLKFIVRSVKTN